MIRLCAPTDEVADSFFAAISMMKDYGITLAEIRGILDKNVIQLTDDEAKYCYKLLQEKGINVWAISSPIGKTDPTISDEEFIDKVKNAIRVAKLFHTNLIRIFSFFNAYDKRDEVIRKFRMCVEMCKKENIVCSLENEKLSYADTPERVIDLLDNVPGLLHNYDASNFEQTGVDSMHCLKTVFHRCYYVHFKDGIHVDDDAHITPVGEGHGNIPALLNMIKDDKVLSLEHHLRFPLKEKKEKYEDIKDSQEFVYRDTSEAFIDAVKHARKVLKEAGYKEIEINKFVK